MISQFLVYFFRYIFFSKTRQRPLLIAMGGLALSSFALVVLHSSMGGLQRGLVARSKEVQGQGVLSFSNTDKSFVLQLAEKINSWPAFEKHLRAYPSLEIELLIRRGNFLAPALVFGYPKEFPLPPFLSPEQKGQTLMGVDLAHKLRASYHSKIQLISPSHTTAMMGEIPRLASTNVSDLVFTGLPEVDGHHIYTRASLLANLFRAHRLNRIRLYGDFDIAAFSRRLKEEFGSKVELRSWEQQNSSLVYALRLENRVMLSLFVAMTALVALAITAGFLIFFGNIQGDLASFWILGSHPRELNRGAFWLVQGVGVSAALVGLFCGLLFLWGWQSYAPDIMPDIFIDRKIPIHVTKAGVMISFFVPYGIASFFSFFALRYFWRDRPSFLFLLRGTGG